MTTSPAKKAQVASILMARGVVIRIVRRAPIARVAWTVSNCVQEAAYAPLMWAINASMTWTALWARSAKIKNALISIRPNPKGRMVVVRAMMIVVVPVIVKGKSDHTGKHNTVSN